VFPEPATGPYAEPDKSVHFLVPYFFEIHSNMVAKDGTTVGVKMTLNASFSSRF
jgi:hypothetical protein